jgi:hypothetical protein
VVVLPLLVVAPVVFELLVVVLYELVVVLIFHY